MEQIKDYIQRYRYELAFAGMGFIYLCNLFLDIMDVDAAQYASISREMMESGSYLEVYHRGADYLDKPPLLFWLSSLSMSLFGVNNVAFKLPALLVILLGIYSTYRLSTLVYGKETGRLAALILGYSQAVFLMTNDIRTDGMLMGWVIFAIWQIYEFSQNNRWKHLLLGSFGVGLAMLTKGPLGLIIPAAAFFTEFALKRKWSQIFRWEWLVGILVVLITLAPMLWGLYNQFDLHPEKEVYGLQGPSGVKFFFWTQSFGRITGDIYWDNGAPFYYLLGTLLWDFQPWIFLLFPALFVGIRELARLGFKGTENKEYVSLGGFVLVFLMLSASRYKLPHYIFPLLPFAAMLSAQWFMDLKENGLEKLNKIQFAFLHLFYVAIGVYFYFCFTPSVVLDTTVLLLGLTSFWAIYRYLNDPKEKFIFMTVVAGLCLNLVICLHFYPNILPYQSSTEVGRKVHDAKKEWNEFYSLYTISQSLDFYSQRINHYRFPGKMVDECNVGGWVYTNERGLAEIDSLAPGRFKLIETYDSYKVSNLSLDFLLRNRRPKVLKQRYLLEKQR